MICDKYFHLYDKSGKGTELVFEEIENPVRHGRWIDDTQEGKGEWLLCSECGESSPEVADWDYCPNCGAKMDGGAEQ